MSTRTALVVVVGICGIGFGCGDDTATGAGGTGASNTGGQAIGGSGGEPAGGANTGGTSTGGANTGGAGGGMGGQQAGGAAPNSGDCETEADCGGLPCLEVANEGYRVCGEEPAEATECLNAEFDECCTTADCAEGTCYAMPITPYCGGPAPLEYNVCAVDQCENQGDCGNDAVCLPGPMLGYKVRACFPAACRRDTDCDAEAGGICAPVSDPCCGGAAGLFCVYPTDGCRTNADCPDGYCQPAEDRATCEPGAPICPA